MDALKLRFRRDLVGRQFMRENLQEEIDFLYTSFGLAFTTLYTFRTSRSYSIDPYFVADFLFSPTANGVGRARTSLNKMVKAGLIKYDVHDRYRVDASLSASEDDEPFFWFTLEDFNKIKDGGGKAAPELFYLYSIILSTRNSRLGWVAGDRSREQLVEMSGLSKRTVTRYVAKLQELKVLYVKPRPPKFGVNQTNIYGAYSDKDKIDKLVTETVEGSKRGFKISVSRRYDEVLQRDGADYTVAELERLIEDVKEYNRLVEKNGTGARKNLLLLEEIRDRLVDEAAIDAQVEEEFNSKYGYGEEQDDSESYENENEDEDDGVVYVPYDTHEVNGYDGPDMSGQKIRTPEEEARIDEIGRQQWMKGYMEAMQEWEEKHKSDKRPSDEELAMIENESYDPRENYDDWSPTPEGRKHLSAMGIVEPVEDESEDDDIDALFA